MNYYLMNRYYTALATLYVDAETCIYICECVREAFPQDCGDVWPELQAVTQYCLHNREAFDSLLCTELKIVYFPYSIDVVDSIKKCYVKCGSVCTQVKYGRKEDEDVQEKLKDLLKIFEGQITESDAVISFSRYQRVLEDHIADCCVVCNQGILLGDIHLDVYWSMQRFVERFRELHQDHVQRLQHIYALEIELKKSGEDIDGLYQNIKEKIKRGEAASNDPEHKEMRLYTWLYELREKIVAMTDDQFHNLDFSMQAALQEEYCHALKADAAGNREFSMPALAEVVAERTERFWKDYWESLGGELPKLPERMADNVMVFCILFWLFQSQDAAMQESVYGYLQPERDTSEEWIKSNSKIKMLDTGYRKDTDLDAYKQMLKRQAQNKQAYERNYIPWMKMYQVIAQNSGKRNICNMEVFRNYREKAAELFFSLLKDSSYLMKSYNAEDIKKKYDDYAMKLTKNCEVMANYAAWVADESIPEQKAKEAAASYLAYWAKMRMLEAAVPVLWIGETALALYEQEGKSMRKYSNLKNNQRSENKGNVASKIMKKYVNAYFGTEMSEAMNMPVETRYFLPVFDSVFDIKNGGVNLAEEISDHIVNQDSNRYACMKSCERVLTIHLVNDSIFQWKIFSYLDRVGLLDVFRYCHAKYPIVLPEFTKSGDIIEHFRTSKANEKTAESATAEPVKNPQKTVYNCVNTMFSHIKFDMRDFMDTTDFDAMKAEEEKRKPDAI